MAYKYKITILNQEDGFSKELYFDEVDVRVERGVNHIKDSSGNVVEVVPNNRSIATIKAFAGCDEETFKTDESWSKSCSYVDPKHTIAESSN